MEKVIVWFAAYKLIIFSFCFFILGLFVGFILGMAALTIISMKEVKRRKKEWKAREAEFLEPISVGELKSMVELAG